MKERKHIFFIHSPLTFIVACKIIRLKKLRAGEVIFFTHRGFQPPATAWPTHIFPYNWSPEPFRFQLNFVKSWKKVQEFDDFINTVSAHAPFLLYLPHAAFRVLKLFISHPRCQGFSYIEEGLGSYSRKEYFDVPRVDYRVHPLDRLLNRGRIKDRLYYAEGYDAVYGLYKESFPGFRNRIIFQHSSAEEELSSSVYGARTDFNRYKQARIIVLDAVSVHGILPAEVHLHAFLKLLKKLEEEGVLEVFIKYHPAQIPAGEDKLFRLAAQKQQSALKLLEIEQGVFLEDVAHHSLSPVFYVNISSIAIYANKAGKKVYCWAPYLMEENEAYRNIFQGLNRIFSDSVEVLKDK